MSKTNHGIARMAIITTCVVTVLVLLLAGCKPAPPPPQGKVAKVKSLEIVSDSQVDVYVVGAQFTMPKLKVTFEDDTADIVVDVTSDMFDAAPSTATAVGQVDAVITYDNSARIPGDQKSIVYTYYVSSEDDAIPVVENARGLAVVSMNVVEGSIRDMYQVLGAVDLGGLRFAVTLSDGSDYTASVTDGTNLVIDPANLVITPGDDLQLHHNEIGFVYKGLTVGTHPIRVFALNNPRIEMVVDNYTQYDYLIENAFIQPAAETVFKVFNGDDSLIEEFVGNGQVTALAPDMNSAGTGVEVGLTYNPPYGAIISGSYTINIYDPAQPIPGFEGFDLISTGVKKDFEQGDLFTLADISGLKLTLMIAGRAVSASPFKADGSGLLDGILISPELGSELGSAGEKTISFTVNDVTKSYEVEVVALRTFSFVLGSTAGYNPTESLAVTLPENLTQHDGKFIMLPDGTNAKKNGYVLDAWVDNATGKKYTIGQVVPVTKDMEFEPRWVFDRENYGPGTGKTVSDGKKISMEMMAVPLKGYSMAHVNNPVSIAPPLTYDMLTSEVLVTYKFFQDLQTLVPGYQYSTGTLAPKQGHIKNGVGGTTNSQHPVTFYTLADAMVFCNQVTEWYNTQATEKPFGETLQYSYYYKNGEGDPVLIKSVTAAPAIGPDTLVVSLRSENEQYSGFRLPNSTMYSFYSKFAAEEYRLYDGKKYMDLYEGHAYPFNILNSVAGATDRSLEAIVEAAHITVGTEYVVNQTAPVKRGIPNDLGLYDVSGNVYEMTHTFYGASNFRLRGGDYARDAWLTPSSLTINTGASVGNITVDRISGVRLSIVQW